MKSVKVQKDGVTRVVPENIAGLYLNMGWTQVDEKELKEEKSKVKEL